MISLTVPADEVSMAVLCATAGAIAVRASLTLDQVGDVRMAVEEAAMLLMPSGHPITMRADADSRPFVVEISTADAAGIEMDPDSLPWIVLSGISDQVDVVSDGERTSLRLRFEQVVANR